MCRLTSTIQQNQIPQGLSPEDKIKTQGVGLTLKPYAFLASRSTYFQRAMLPALKPRPMNKTFSGFVNDEHWV
jgi:hypothetical protein